MGEEKELSTSDKLEIAFAKERKDISSYIQNHITNNMGSIENIADVQVHILSKRQILVDKSNEMRAGIRKRSKNIASMRKSKYRFYKTEFDLKLSDYEITRHIDADVEETVNLIKMIENQIVFYKETIDGLDKCTYMIKYLIEVKKYMAGGF